jgi:hypothetical protein
MLQVLQVDGARLERRFRSFLAQRRWIVGGGVRQVAWRLTGGQHVILGRGAVKVQPRLGQTLPRMVHVRNPSSTACGTQGSHRQEGQVLTPQATGDPPAAPANSTFVCRSTRATMPCMVRDRRPPVAARTDDGGLLAVALGTVAWPPH